MRLVHIIEPGPRKQLRTTRFHMKSGQYRPNGWIST